MGAPLSQRGGGGGGMSRSLPEPLPSLESILAEEEERIGRKTCRKAIKASKAKKQSDGPWRSEQVSLNSTLIAPL